MKTLEKGKTKIKVKGANGLKQIVYSVTTKDGIETDRVVLSEKTVRKPVDQIVAVGTKQKAKVQSKKTVVTSAGTSLNYQK